MFSIVGGPHLSQDLLAPLPVPPTVGTKCPPRFSWSPCSIAKTHLKQLLWFPCWARQRVSQSQAGDHGQAHCWQVLLQTLLMTCFGKPVPTKKKAWAVFCECQEFSFHIRIWIYKSQSSPTINGTFLVSISISPGRTSVWAAQRVAPHCWTGRSR